MIRAIDHIVILVNDLQQASADYRALGFTVTPGGEHTGGATHNALVCFADGCYFELIAFRRAAPDHHWYRHLALGEGLIDYALLPSEIGVDLDAARKRGLALEGPFPGGRLRPDGERIEWQTGRAPTPDLPFFCADLTPRRLRVPDGAAQRHPNGVIGVAALTIAVHDLAESTARYRALLGVTDGPPFALGAAELRLADADTPGLAARQRMALRGEGPLAIELRNNANTGSLDLALTHSVPITLVNE